MASVDARVLRSDPAPVIVMTVIPLVFVPFLMPGARAQLALAGHPDATGAEYAVPGLAVLFALLCVQQVVSAFFRERDWGTWDRLRSSPATIGALLAGKSVTALGAQFLQVALVLLGGALLFGYRPTGSIAGVAIVALVFSVTMVAFGLLVVAAFRTLDQALAAGNIVAMMMAGVGGAFGPVDALPQWMQSVAVASPAYWALDALTALTLDGARLVDVVAQLTVLAGFAVVFVVAALVLFAVRESRSAR